MQNIPLEAIEGMREKMTRNEGTIMFSYISETLFNSQMPEILFELTAGSHYFELIRDTNLALNFVQANPGTGTRIASVDLNKMQKHTQFVVALTWSPSCIGLTIYNGFDECLHSDGVKASFEYQITDDGMIIKKDKSILSMRMSANGSMVVEPTALNAWNECRQALEVLRKGTSEEGYIFEVVRSNFCLSALVTGFEVYCKTRFLELEKEGIEAKIEDLLNVILSKNEKEGNYSEVLRNDAISQNITFLDLLAAQKINFQSFKECKRAYNKAYGIKFGNIGCENSTLMKINKYLLYRHRIVHVSPLLGTLNLKETPPEAPVFPSNELITDAISCFDELINNIHQASLKIRRKD